MALRLRSFGPLCEVVKVPRSLGLGLVLVTRLTGPCPRVTRHGSVWLVGLSGRVASPAHVGSAPGRREQPRRSAIKKQLRTGTDQGNPTD